MIPHILHFITNDNIKSTTDWRRIYKNWIIHKWTLSDINGIVKVVLGSEALEISPTLASVIILQLYGGVIIFDPYSIPVVNIQELFAPRVGAEYMYYVGTSEITPFMAAPPYTQCISKIIEGCKGKADTCLTCRQLIENLGEKAQTIDADTLGKYIIYLPVLGDAECTSHTIVKLITNDCVISSQTDYDTHTLELIRERAYGKHKRVCVCKCGKDTVSMLECMAFIETGGMRSLLMFLDDIPPMISNYLKRRGYVMKSRRIAHPSP